LVRELLESIGIQILTEEKHERADKRSLLRYALATAPIYGISGYGPSGPAPTFADANLTPGPSCELAGLSERAYERKKEDSSNGIS
jgi:hypothetical protein